MSPSIDTSEQGEMNHALQLVTEARDEWHRLFDEVNAKYTELSRVHAALLDERASVEPVVMTPEHADIAALKLDLAKADANAHVLLEALLAEQSRMDPGEFLSPAQLRALDMTPSEALIEVARKAYTEGFRSMQTAWTWNRSPVEAWEKSETLKKLKGAA